MKKCNKMLLFININKAMTFEEVKNYFGSQRKATRAINRSHQVWASWKRHGSIPLKHQFAFHKISNGELKVTPPQ